ncbi:hypothetical protein AYI70_g2148 [Smittium culicis]|uniref:Uncharacterized protein n=1 Tax=Smittium culicis TaxID=133412 RepID=A0A1R1Y9T0_9FUNG|nr:hypothetical protein AYI70_g2148 [Smittium culicis]
MKFTSPALLMACIALFSVSSLPAERRKRDIGRIHDGIEQISNQVDAYSNTGDELEDVAIAKRDRNSRPYRKNGRSYYFNKQSSNTFIVSLAYRPNNFYGQKFQLLYQSSPEFQAYWNSDSSFRRSWNSDSNFRNYWLATVYPYGLAQYRQGGNYYNIYSKKVWSRSGSRSRYGSNSRGKSNNWAKDSSSGGKENNWSNSHRNSGEDTERNIRGDNKVIWNKGGSSERSGGGSWNRADNNGDDSN